ncbi:Uncharacterised protein [Corynebacterium pseudotuberculosis]|nr:Uncharacterised protein [Corynebacterium pseudotuberculosis]
MSALKFKVAPSFLLDGIGKVSALNMVSMQIYFFPVAVKAIFGGDMKRNIPGVFCTEQEKPEFIGNLSHYL